MANPELAVGIAERLRVGTDHAVRLGALGGEISHLDETQDRLVDLSTDGEITKDAYQQKRERLARRKAAPEREQAPLRSTCELRPDPEMLRERMPDVLRFIREWVTEADGDELTLVLQALRCAWTCLPRRADIRVEVPMIEAVEGAGLVTTARTSVSGFRSYKIDRVPLVVTVPIAVGRAGSGK